MKNKLWMILGIILLLSSCQSLKKVDKAAENNGTTAKRINEEIREENQGQVENTEVGKKTTIISKKDIKVEDKSDIFTVKVTGVQVSNMQPNKEGKKMFDSEKDNITVVTVAYDIENMTGDTYSLAPDKGKLTTNTGEESQAKNCLSDAVGGNFIGRVKKTGNVIYFLDGDPKKIDSIKLVIAPPLDAKDNSIGKEINLDINLK